MLSLKENAFYNGLNVLLSLAFPVVTFPYVARVLSPSGLGQYAFASSVLSYALMIASLGIPLYGVRACARVRDDRNALTRVTQELVLLNLIAAAVALVVLAALVAATDRLRQEAPLLAVMSVSVVLSAPALQACCQALEQYRFIAGRNLIVKALSLVLILVFVRGPGDLLTYAAIMVLGTVGPTLANAAMLAQHVDFRPVTHVDVLRHVRPAATMWSITAAISVYTVLPVTLLGFMADSRTVGLYAVAQKVCYLLVALATSLGAVMLPRLSHLVARGNMREFRRLLRMSFNAICFLTIPLAALMILQSADVVQLIAGGAYIEAAWSQRLLAPVIVLVGCSNVIGVQAFMPLGRERDAAWSVAGGAFASLVLCLALIPVYAHAGAAIAATLAEVVVLGAMWRLGGRQLALGIPTWESGGYILAAAIAAGTSLLVGRMDVLPSSMGMLLRAGTFGAVYLGILTLLRDSMLVVLWNSLRQMKFASLRPAVPVE